MLYAFLHQKLDFCRQMQTEVIDLRWKALFLAIVLLSAVAATVSIATLNISVPKIRYLDTRKVTGPVIGPLDPIDDESGGG